LTFKLFDNIKLLKQLTTYNLKIIFAGKFFYFLLASFAVFILITGINLFDADWYPNEAEVYYLLLFPGLLLIFYPITYGIQNDTDTRMIELLFGIPNYRYKVWLLRLAIIYIIVLVILILLCILSAVALVPVSVTGMSVQLMFPVFFLGALSFMFSTIIRSGHGTAAIMAVLGLVVWISSGIFGESEWNIFLNPFDIPQTFSHLVWSEMLFYNRLYLLIGSVLALLAGLYKLQYREKFI